MTRLRSLQPGGGRLRAFLVGPALFLALMIAACAGRPGPGVLDPTSMRAPGAKLVTVLVATDRDESGPNGAYGSGRSSVLHYEAITISVPPGHETGRIEWPKDRPDPSRTFATVERRRLDEREFLKRARDLSAEKRSDVGVFVHGYNNSFQEALFRFAQLAADGHSPIVPILFSWPSDAAVTGYAADREAVTFARDHLVGVLTDLSKALPERRITLIGHSMGGWLVMEALRQLRLERRDGVVSRLQVALAAPDIDVDVFRSQLAVVGPLSPPLLLLVSPDDFALDVSSRIAGRRPRVGSADVTDPRLQVIARREKVLVVDISALAAGDAMRHDRFVSFASVYAEGPGSTSRNGLRAAGAYVFNAAGAAVASPFTLAGSVLSSK